MGGIAWTTLAHEALWKELPSRGRDEAHRAMKAVAARPEPARHPDVRSIAASAFPRSYRLRVGRFRILFIVFPDEHMIVFTTAFLKRRETDYEQAVRRHDARVRTYE